MTEPTPTYPQRLYGRLRCLAAAFRGHVRKAASVIVATIEGIIANHRNRMRDNRNYRQAILASVTAIVTVMTLDPVVAAAITATVALYVAAFQDGDDPGWRPDPYRPW